MPRFYFNMGKQGHIETDPEGTELSDLEAAKDEALHAAREILANALKNPRPQLFDCFVITDDSGQELATVSLKDALPKGLC